MSERPEELELTALASALRDLRPSPEALDRAALMYRAGCASAHGWGWPLATAAAGVLATILGVLLLLRPAPPVVERVVYLPVPQPESPVTQPEESAPPFPDDAGRGTWSHYVHLQEQVLDHGLDGLPAPSNAPQEQTPSVESLLRSL
ncbi:MAG TPA: hypothetical protein VH575_22395 [Gemmataceae bacterium]|jgi:hypothetical protein